MSYTFGELNDSYNVVELRVMARKHGIVPGNKRKKELINAIIRKLKREKVLWKSGAFAASITSLFLAYGLNNYKTKYERLKIQEKKLSDELTNLETENKKVKSIVKNIRDNNRSATFQDVKKLLSLVKTLHHKNIKLAGKNREVLKKNHELLKALKKQTTKNENVMKGIDQRMQSGFEHNQQRLNLMRFENTSLLSKLKELMENLTNSRTKTYSAPPPLPPKPKYYR